MEELRTEVERARFHEDVFQLCVHVLAYLTHCCSNWQL